MNPEVPVPPPKSAAPEPEAPASDNTVPVVQSPSVAESASAVTPPLPPAHAIPESKQTAPGGETSAAGSFAPSETEKPSMPGNGDQVFQWGQQAQQASVVAEAAEADEPAKPAQVTGPQAERTVPQQGAEWFDSASPLSATVQTNSNVWLYAIAIVFFLLLTTVAIVYFSKYADSSSAAEERPSSRSAGIASVRPDSVPGGANARTEPDRVRHMAEQPSSGSERVEVRGPEQKSQQTFSMAEKTARATRAQYDDRAIERDLTEETLRPAPTKRSPERDVAGDNSYSRPAPTVASNSGKQLPTVCPHEAFTQERFNAVREGMSKDEVSNVFGCGAYPYRTLRGENYVAYNWQSNTGPYVTVYFDNTGSFVKKSQNEASFKYGFNF